MPISYVGGAAVASSATTLPTHQVGDLIVVFSFRRNSDTVPPTLPSGWTLISSVGNAGVSFTAGWRIATSTDTVVSGWTNTSRLTAHIYRGADKVNPIGDIRTNVGVSNPATVGALTLQRATGSWEGVAIGGHNATSPFGITPSQTLRNTVYTDSTRASSYDSNGVVTTSPSMSIDTGGATGRAILRYEVREAYTSATNALTGYLGFDALDVVDFVSPAGDLTASIESAAEDRVDYSLSGLDLESSLEFETVSTEMHPETGAEPLESTLSLDETGEAQAAVDQVEFEVQAAFETPVDDADKFDTTEDFSTGLQFDPPEDSFGTHMTAEAEPLVLDFGQVNDYFNAVSETESLDLHTFLESQDSLQTEGQADSLALSGTFEDAEIDDSPLNIEMPAEDFTTYTVMEAVQGKFSGAAEAFVVNLTLSFSDAWLKSDRLNLPVLTTVLPHLNVSTALPGTGTLTALPTIVDVPCNIGNISTDTAVPTTSGPATVINVPLGVTTVTATGINTSIPSIDIINPIPEE